MGSLRLTLCTGLLAVTALAPVAHTADDSHGVSVTPASPAPGTDVALRVRGCTGSQGTAVSSAFVSGARLTGAQGALSGETRVRSTLAPGAYDVKVTCAGSVLTGTVTVVGKGAGQSGRTDLFNQFTQPSVPPSPVAPVQAGGGGTAHFATVAGSGSGPGTVQAVTGLALAGTAAAAVGLLRARRSRGTD
ncbi:hypothetical protein AQI88_20370 [Streptomyces cellostaticus]|uniref:Sortase n=1 Tax=Streptomyces cellostaticus TaxID=67285 RepID=A0A117PW30_9ACTN|nr:hypothetical protein [Streptomyces cellostaticus]KUM94553.1 hypothetical protein AQI88_20370 [Streptomyces cellostaticus]GHI07441.1 hypothetical protein Scel_57620 [Streptomyces cellostaticus]